MILDKLTTVTSTKSPKTSHPLQKKVSASKKINAWLQFSDEFIVRILILFTIWLSTCVLLSLLYEWLNETRNETCEN